jgi:arylsulfatase A-like enzyme
MFLLFHTNIVHDYFANVNEKYFKESSYANLSNPFADWEEWAFPEVGFQLASADTAEQEDFIKARYYAGVEYMDKKIGKLLSMLDESDFKIVVVSDHGEGFDRSRYRIHHGGRLHDDQVHVPLFFKNFEKDIYSEQLVSTTDIIPTVLNELGFPNEVVNKFDGIPLQEKQLERSVYMEDSKYLFVENSFNRIGSPAQVRTGLKGVVNNDGQKYVRSIVGESVTTKEFNLVDDPFEDNPVYIDSNKKVDTLIGEVTMALELNEKYSYFFGNVKREQFANQLDAIRDNLFKISSEFEQISKYRTYGILRKIKNFIRKLLE